PPWGWDRPPARPAIREMVEICRTMWCGGTPPSEGKILQTSGRELSFSPGHPIPILIAARGRQMLAVAAEVADIVHIATPFLGPRYMQSDVDHVIAAADSAGRPASAYEIDMTIALSVSSDANFARYTGKSIAAVGILWMANAERRDTTGELVSTRAAELPDEFAVPQATVDAISTEWNMWSGERLSPTIARMIDDQVLAQFVVAGGPSECRDQLLRISEELPQITGLRFKLPPLTGPEAYPRLREMIEIVGGFDELRALGADHSPMT
ncbi:MAG: LLM class flavin-dependent oxidoreductase, partial [Acidimicrobiaceae bacterium]|nr:LLM class flavin-dependent oxidoreductase [Acidimicrobiaceae bacterium]